MRMAASWSGRYDLPNTGLWRDDRARWQAPPLIIVPTTTSVAAVLVPVKARPGNDGACGQGRATADLDRPCARRPQHVWVGAKKRDSESNKETGMKEVESGVKYMLDFKSPIQGLLRLHTCYGPPDRSAAQGDLCHEASAHAVTRTSRSSASGSIDNSPGGIFLH